MDMTEASISIHGDLNGYIHGDIGKPVDIVGNFLGKMLRHSLMMT